MKKQLFLLLTFFISLALLNSCKKVKNDVPAKTIVGKWKQISGIYSPAYFGETDYFSSYDACDKDDIVEFKSDNTFELTEGAIKCDPSDPQIILSGNYTVNQDLTSITVNGETSIIELTGTTLKVTHPFSDAGISYSDISTFQKQ